MAETRKQKQYVSISYLEVRDYQCVKIFRGYPNIAGAVSIYGQNGDGKSTILGAIENALRGKRFDPDMPIREGQHTAEIIMQLNGYKVVKTFTDKGSYVRVYTEDGSQIAKPQKWLDSLLIEHGGFLAFEPLKFFDDTGTASDAIRKNILLQAMQVPDVTEQFTEIIGVTPEGENIIERHTKAIAHVTDEQKEIRVYLKRLNAQVVQMDAPPQPPDLSALRLQRDKAIKSNAEVSILQRQKDTANDRAIQLEEEIHTKNNELDKLWTRCADRKNKITADYEERIRDLKEQMQEDLLEADKSAQSLENSLKSRVAEMEAEQIQSVKDANLEVPQLVDVTILDQGIVDAENRQKRYDDYKAQLSVRDTIVSQEQELKTLEDKKTKVKKVLNKALKTARTPIKGYSFDELGQTLFQGKPVAQECTSRKLKEAFKIIIAVQKLTEAEYARAGKELPQQLKVALVRNGNDLDDESMDLLKKAAKKFDMQIWIERIAPHDSENIEGFAIKEGTLYDPGSGATPE